VAEQHAPQAIGHRHHELEADPRGHRVVELGIDVQVGPVALLVQDPLGVVADQRAVAIERRQRIAHGAARADQLSDHLQHARRPVLTHGQADGGIAADLAGANQQLAPLGEVDGGSHVGERRGIDGAALEQPLLGDVAPLQLRQQRADRKDRDVHGTPMLRRDPRYPSTVLERTPRSGQVIDAVGPKVSVSHNDLIRHPIDLGYQFLEFT
jgi:hypothetical protein